MAVLLKDIVSKSPGTKVLRWESYLTINKSNWETIFSSENLTISLEGFDILGHDGLIWIIFICLERRIRKLFTHLELPSDERQIAFIKYVGILLLQKALNFSFTNAYRLDFSVEYKPSSKQSNYLKNIHVVDKDNWDSISSDTTKHVSDYISNIYKLTNFQGDEVFEGLYPFIRTLQEFLLNIPLHGGTESGKGIGLISTTLPPKNYNRIRYCFSDIGEGMKHTLSRNHNIKCSNDTEAIYQALLFRYGHKKGGVLGLYPTLRFIKERKGMLGIRTGNSFMQIDFSKRQNFENFDKDYDKPTVSWLKSISQHQYVASLPGTHIYVDLVLPENG